MSAELQTAFADQAKACTTLGSPFMGRLLSLLAEDWPTRSRLAARCAAFTGDLGPASVSVPLRVAGGLHALRLRGDAALAAVYPPQDVADDPFRAAILDALERHDDFLTAWVESPPQTNELRRSAALIPAARLVAARFGLPITLSELGASGGLNLMWDRFALEAADWRVGPADAVVTLRPEWDGPAPGGADPVIASRRGVDLSPLDPTDDEDLLRLTAYLWPDQPHRLTNTRAAAGAVPAPVDQGDAIDWLAARLDAASEGQVHLIQNTVAWQYFPAEAQARGRALIDAAGARATQTRPLAWMQLETDGDLHGQGGAPILLRMWPGGDELVLGRADFHGRWVRWHGADCTG
ncbi:DUF2332 family protein [Aliishimia ponticola]|uniref:DUF2332 family protein n=1 Tax=Aliishimia ponticola TaxID=2499833 RepID=A0A4S4NEI1_9RHOB|nr:DUF2332 family protein [Aliishimia ponticola]THH37165.1 DUF2332 family protein [Aliishimia ponticola]